MELFPAEERAVATAVAGRRREFATVRQCARQALAELGIAPVAILPGEGRAPRWPPGIVGSMTHCDGYRAAAVARDSDMRAVGIDAEPHEPLPRGVLRRIALDPELAELVELHAGAGGIHWDRVLFACKEAVYKAWFPLAGTGLGFQDARLALDPAAGTFTAHLPAPGADLPGRWVVEDGIVVTAVALGAG